MYYYGPSMENGDWGWGLFMMLFWLLVLVLMVYFGFRLLSSRDQNGTPEHRDPLDIARERYAKGEINKEQFEQLKKDLSK